MTVNDAVANRVLTLMHDRQMTQYRLEQITGIAHGAMDRILSGTNKTVTLTTCYKLAMGFDMSINEFFSDEVFKLTNLDIEY
ncbi:MAG: helix-turn-helix transcriptional regulator [Clostridia bacterium]|nr:helix-turn-helix transcriptional regulator [Clostridia bacterium]